MVINREFFFRGWLPAGLVVNARLLSSAPNRTRQAVMKPILCPVPGAGWPIDQPFPVFPIDQANGDTAIVLVDPMPQSALALLPLGAWYGDGTPYVLGMNTWYEGRIRTISGADVMAIRIVAAATPRFYSNYAGLEQKDVSVVSMACHLIVGRRTEQVLAVDANDLTSNELGYRPMVTSGSDQLPARVFDVLEASTASFAGMRVGYEEQNAGSAKHYIQCVITDGKYPGKTPDFIGILATPKLGKQKFYSLLASSVQAVDEDIASPGYSHGTVARGRSDEQVVHYN